MIFTDCANVFLNENKNQTDFCGEFNQKFIPIESKFTELVEVTEDKKVKVVFEESKPKRGRKPKNVD
jgi:hypothetical protein